VTSIRCHTCNEMGHKASQCPYATNTPKGPSGYTPQQVSATVGRNGGRGGGREGGREGGTDPHASGPVWPCTPAGACARALMRACWYEGCCVREGAASSDDEWE
jgi:hypothetical protein